eukprot:TRINITY_DN4343_c0_g2_i1.p1 TRINITY_DN4343_c0_g2~~TRINITY_DN4343_c0_g2_i1.p1  ORF type:complete len:213 (-),score=40.38 TRINITY_DN4343_c0_g2_i1:24-617(-)
MISKHISPLAQKATSTRTLSTRSNRTQKRFKNYMVAIDGSHHSIEALRHCKDIVKEDDSITLLHVVDPKNIHANSALQLQFPTESDSDNIERELELIRDNLLEDLYTAIPSLPEGIELLIRTGPPPLRVCEEVQEQKVDYLFVGDKGHGDVSVKRFILGSFANYCVNHAPCAVMVIKDKKRAIKDYHHMTSIAAFPN